RSGMKVNYPGSVVVLGDVNPGAEIMADGNVIIWGCVRGQVTAGAKGDKQAVICALELKPIQVQIAGMAGKKGVQYSKPVKINCQNSELVFTNWKH
ncbi:MAG TPA: septum site-determining protein MinC, partial [Anaerolineaceae bacterium]|nr:septum site-determining protein MinC [Anaerolineaceae bacterium]